MRRVATTCPQHGAARRQHGVAQRRAQALHGRFYGFAQADAIYDFKRVDPDWEDTLRVTTIPTQSGTFGNDGDFVFSVRQSRLGVKGGYGEDITYKLEGELFGVGVDEGQTTLRVRHAWATYKDFWHGPDLVELHGHRHLPQHHRLLGPHRHGVLPQPAGAVHLPHG